MMKQKKTTIVDTDVKNAKKSTESHTPGFAVYTDGSRTEEGAVGYSVVWQKGHTWKGCDQEIAIARALKLQRNGPNAASWKLTAGFSAGRPGRLHLRPGRAWVIQVSEISAGKVQAF